MNIKAVVVARRIVINNYILNVVIINNRERLKR